MYWNLVIYFLTESAPIKKKTEIYELLAVFKYLSYLRI